MQVLRLPHRGNMNHRSYTRIGNIAGQGNFWLLVLLVDSSTKVILDGFETKHVTG